MTAPEEPLHDELSDGSTHEETNEQESQNAPEYTED